MITNKVYWHRSLASDELLGRVDQEGKVYETRFGPDKYVGRVDFMNGRIYEARIGPDNYIGRVDLQDGKIYLAVLGPDEYQGRIETDGRIFYHRPLAHDPYIGKVVEMGSIAHGGAAFLLLVLPKLQEEAEEQAREENE